MSSSTVISFNPASTTSLARQGIKHQPIPANILSQIFGGREPEVVLFERHLLEEIKLECCESVHVGITFVILKADDLIVCLTGHSRIYLFRPTLEGHTKNLQRILKLDGLKFYTHKGDLAARKLYATYGIDLPVYNPIDLASFDIYLSMRRYTLGGQAQRDHYTPEFFYGAGVPRRSYPELADHYLGLKGLSIKFDELEKEALCNQSLCELSRNAIIRRAGLTRELGLEMSKKDMRIREQEFQNLYSLAIRASPDQLELYDQTDDNSYDVYLSHLGGTPLFDV